MNQIARSILACKFSKLILAVKWLLLLGVLAFAGLIASNRGSFSSPFIKQVLENKTCTDPLKPPRVYRKLFEEAKISVSPTCNKSSYNAIAIVVSAPRNSRIRDFHRETLGQAIPVYFVLAKSFFPSESALVLAESDRYHDIIIGNFIDHYFWLTMKTYLKLLWVRLACQPPPKFVIYFDDDSVINFDGIMRKLRLENAASNEPKIYGHSTVLEEFSRNPCSKWYVPENLYPQHLVPVGLEYAFGYFSILVNGAHEKLLDALQTSNTSLVWHEDVTWYGILRNISGTELIGWNNHAYSIGYRKMRMYQLQLLKQRGVRVVPDLVKNGSDRFLFAHLGKGDFYDLVWNSFTQK